VTPELMQQSSALARAYGVTLHTHVAETRDEERFCLEKFGHRPVQYMETLRWVGPDVWYAHAVHVNKAEMTLMSRTGCGVAHCPSSNMRLASGIAPVQQYRAAGVNMGLGVDGSASSDGAHMLGEARRAMLLARLGLSLTPQPRPHPSDTLSTGEGAWMSAREALEMATLTTSARWPQACAPTSSPSTSAASTTPAPLCTTRSLLSSSAPRKRPIT
jgi:8-oxoguanine deaminase